MRRAVDDAFLFPSLLAFLDRALEARTLAPKDEEQERTFSAIDRHARMAGLLEEPEAEDSREGAD